MKVQGVDTRRQFAGYESITETWQRHEERQRGLVVCPVVKHIGVIKFCDATSSECRYKNPVDCELYRTYQTSN